jgi:hypothetical protein
VAQPNSGEEAAHLERGIFICDSCVKIVQVKAYHSKICIETDTNFILWSECKIENLPLNPINEEENTAFRDLIIVDAIFGAPVWPLSPASTAPEVHSTVLLPILASEKLGCDAKILVGPSVSNCKVHFKSDIVLSRCFHQKVTLYSPPLTIRIPCYC